MKQSFEFGAYIPRSFLDEMNHAEAYITARILFWLKEREKISRTDEELAHECRVSAHCLKEWKKKVKETKLGGLFFEVHGFPKKKTFYTRLVLSNSNQSNGCETTNVQSNSDLSYIDNKEINKPPISPRGTFPNFIWEEKTILTIFQHLFPSWIDEQASVEIHEASKLVFVGVKNSFRKTKLEGLMLTNKKFNQIKQTHGLTVEVVNNDSRSF